MHSFVKWTAVLLSGLLAAGTVYARDGGVLDPDRPRNLPVDGPVNVRWDDPAKFTEIVHSGNRYEARRGDWVKDIATYLRTSTAKRMSAGDRLDITIHDITRAGNYEPWRGPNADSIRFVRDIYPPRLTLSFRMTDASGRVVAEGERKLLDLAFNLNASFVNDTDPLRFEKRMIDDWARKEFTRPGV